MLANLHAGRFENALAVGSLVAVIWGLAVSLRAFYVGPLAIAWSHWFGQLLAGTLVCLAMPLLFVAVRDWTTARLGSRQRPVTARQ